MRLAGRLLLDVVILDPAPGPAMLVFLKYICIHFPETSTAPGRDLLGALTRFWGAEWPARLRPPQEQNDGQEAAGRAEGKGGNGFYSEHKAVAGAGVTSLCFPWVVI